MLQLVKGLTLLACVAQSQQVPSREVATDHVRYVEDNIRVAEEPILNHLTESPILARRGLPTRQV